MDNLRDLLIVWALPLIGVLYLMLRMLLKKKYFILIGFIMSFISAYMVTMIKDTWDMISPLYNLGICFVICYGIGYILQVRADKKRKNDK